MKNNVENIMVKYRIFEMYLPPFGRDCLYWSSVSIPFLGYNNGSVAFPSEDVWDGKGAILLDLIGFNGFDGDVETMVFVGWLPVSVSSSGLVEGVEISVSGARGAKGLNDCRAPIGWSVFILSIGPRGPRDDGFRGWSDPVG